MRRRRIERVLTGALVAGLLLPILLALVLGLGGLLGGLGDEAGAVACGRIGLGLGVLWAAAVVVTTFVNALLAVDGGPRRHRPRHPERRRRRQRRLRPAGEGPPPVALS
jgi:hypothetical protein